MRQRRTSATKASRPRRIWPMAPRRISTRCAGAGPVHPPDLDRRIVPAPSRISVSVIRSEDSTPCASCASTERSEPDRTSEAVSPLSGSNSVPSNDERPVVIGEAEGHAIGAGDAPAPGRVVVPLVEMGLQRRVQGLHVRISTRGIEVIEPRRSRSRVTSRASVSKRTGTSNSKPAVMATPAAGAVVKVTRPVVVIDRPAGGLRHAVQGDGDRAGDRLGDGPRPGLRAGGVAFGQLKQGCRPVAGADLLVHGRARRLRWQAGLEDRPNP
jgi:hypothetical protein